MQGVILSPLRSHLRLIALSEKLRGLIALFSNCGVQWERGPGHIQYNLHVHLEQVRVRTFIPPVVNHRLATHMRSYVLTRTTRLVV